MLSASVGSTNYPTRVKMTTRQVDGVGGLQEFVKVVARLQDEELVTSALD